MSLRQLNRSSSGVAHGRKCGPDENQATICANTDTVEPTVILHVRRQSACTVATIADASVTPADFNFCARRTTACPVRVRVRLLVAVGDRTFYVEVPGHR